MKPSPLRALLWKDFRQNRLVLVVVFVILLLAGLNVAVWFVHDGEEFQEASSKALGIAILMSGLLLAVLGATIIAAGRGDRSAAFLAYLPPSRKTVVLSKAFAATSAVVLILLFDIALIGWEGWKDYDFRRNAWGDCPFDWAKIFEVIGVVTATGLLMFGTAWLVGSVTGSTAIATCVGILPLVMVFAAMISTTSAQQPVIPIAAAVLGLIFFVAGWLHELRRKADA